MKNLDKITVNLDIDNKDVTTFCKDVKGVKTTGDHDVTDPPHTDTELGVQADKVLAIQAQRVTDKSPALTRQQKLQYDTMVLMYTDVGLYVQQIARKVAVAAGDIAAGEAVVLRCGFKLKAAPSVHPRGFEVVDSGPNWLHLRVKSAGRYSSCAWRIGIAQVKGTLPATFFPTVYTMECEVILTNIKSGILIAAQVATIVPASHGITMDDANPTRRKKQVPSFAVGEGIENLNWSNAIFVGSK
ncbi:MAG: hypothetical protein WCL06_06990 [Bacteroidota bacterium]